MRKRIGSAVLLIFCVCLFTVSARADMGPKDALTVYLVNPPRQTYYLDLLYENTSGKEVFDNLSPEERAALSPEMLELLCQCGEGLTAALAEGTRIPTFGTLTGKPDGDRMVHRFSYYGLPQTYRIAIVTEDGQLHVSEVFSRAVMQSSITYDLQTGEVYVPPLWHSYAAQFSLTFSATLLLEGIVLALFGLFTKRNVLWFAAVNLVTQVFLTAVVGTALLQGGPLGSLPALLLCEIAVFVAEVAAFAFFLRGRSRGRRIGYAVCANIVSMAAGLIAWDWLYEMLTRLA